MSKYIDHIFYINLDRRTDRREQIETMLRKYDLPFERFSAIETPGEGIVGCGVSHTAVLRLAKARGYNNVLILEDDFEFLVSKDIFESQLQELFEHSPQIPFDVCMLSYNLHRSEPLINPRTQLVSRVLFAQTASGYIVNSQYYDTIIKLYEWAIPLLKQTKQHWIYANDIVWQQLQEKDKWVYFNTRIGRQRAGFSDNAQSFQDHGC